MPSHCQKFSFMQFSLAQSVAGDVMNVTRCRPRVTRRRPVRLPEGEPWHFAHVQWDGGRLVVLSSPPLSLTVRVGPLLRGRIARHRRVWFVPPDSAGNTVVTFRGVPQLIPARVNK